MGVVAGSEIMNNAKMILIMMHSSNYLFLRGLDTLSVGRQLCHNAIASLLKRGLVSKEIICSQGDQIIFF